MRDSTSPSKDSKGSNKGIESLAILPQLNSNGDIQKQGLLLMNGTKKNFRIPFFNEVESSPQSTPKLSPRKSTSEAQYDEAKYESKAFPTNRDPVFDFLKFKNYPAQEVYTTKEVVIEFEKESIGKESSPNGLTVITMDPTMESVSSPRSPRSPKSPISPGESTSPKSTSTFTPRSPSTPRDSSNSPRTLPLREKVHSSGLIVGDDYIKNSTRVRLSPKKRHNTEGQQRWYSNKPKSESTSPVEDKNQIRIHQDSGIEVKDLMGLKKDEERKIDSRPQSRKMEFPNEIFYVKVKQPVLVQLPSPSVSKKQDEVILLPKRRPVSAGSSRRSTPRSSMSPSSPIRISPLSPSPSFRATFYNTASPVQDDDIFNSMKVKHHGEDNDVRRASISTISLRDITKLSSRPLTARARLTNNIK